jgi:hypothetical protein
MSRLLDGICADLRSWGIDAEVSLTSKWEPGLSERGGESATKSRSEGMVTVKQGPVNWVNYRYEEIESGENAGFVQTWLDFEILDSRLRGQLSAKLCNYEAGPLPVSPTS